MPTVKGGDLRDVEAFWDVLSQRRAVSLLGSAAAAGLAGHRRRKPK